MLSNPTDQATFRVRSDGPGNATLTALFLGPWLLLAAAAATVGNVYSESSTSCTSLLDRGKYLTPDPICTRVWDDRLRLIVVLAALGAALVVAACIGLVRSRPLPRAQSGPPVPRWKCLPIAVVGLMAPYLGFPLALVTFGLDRNLNYGSDLFFDWYPLGLTAGVLLASLVAGSSFTLPTSPDALQSPRLTRGYALAMGAIALPVMSAIQLDWNVTRGGDMSDYSPEWSRSAANIAISGLAVAAALVAGVLLQRRGRPAPPTYVGILLLLLGATCLCIISAHEIMPYWRDQEPHEWVYVMLLLAPLVISAFTITRSAGMPVDTTAA